MEKDLEIIVTKEGFAKLKAEHEVLVGQKRKEVAEKIKSARELGDISENSEYDSARDEQAMVEGRIGELEDILKRVVVKGESGHRGRNQVSIGSRVRIHLEGEDMEYEIVGATEADPLANKISHESPLGQALIGRKVGDRIVVEAPVGDLTYTIIEVK